MLAAQMVPFASIAIVNGAASLWVDDRLYETFLRSCLFVFENCAAANIHLYGDVDGLKGAARDGGRDQQPPVRRQANRLKRLIESDWVCLNMLAARSAMQHGLRFVIKSSIHFVPLYGWYTLQRGYVYVRRFGSFTPKPIVRQLGWLSELGEAFWLHVFPEGTRFNRHRTKEIAEAAAYCRRRELPKLRHVWPPRSGAVTLSIAELRGVLDALYDVTIAYGQTLEPGRQDDAPTMYEFVCGRGDRHNHRSHPPAPAVQLGHPNEHRGDQRSGCTLDSLLAHFYANGCFPDVVETPARRQSIVMNFVCFSALNAAVLAAVFSPNVRRFYALTILSSPLLLVWNQLRGFI
ncbi:Acyltransferase [Aphelenchoides fujianensis]|nr:Acyltransferase [Aphelenchoides fujianensis]